MWCEIWNGFIIIIFCIPKVFFKVYFVDYAIIVFPIFPSLSPLHPAYPLPPAFLPFSSCQWVIHISSLASPFPILFLTSPCVFCTYQLCFLFPVPFPLFSPLHLPVDNPPCDLHFGDTIPVLVVCLVVFVLGLVVDSCEFVVILLFIVLIFFFLDKSL